MGLTQGKGESGMKIEITLPKAIMVDVPGVRVIAICTNKWDEDFILEGLERAVREKVLQQARLGKLEDGLTLLEGGHWSERKQAAEEAKAKKWQAAKEKAIRAIAVLSPTQRQAVLEVLSERHKEEPCE
jgi:hypothetical protein